MPKLILATVTLLFGRSSSAHAAADSSAAAVHSAMHARTRGRDATRRLRATGHHDPRFDLGPLSLTRRH